MKNILLAVLMFAHFTLDASETDVITIPPCPKSGVIRTYVVSPEQAGLERHPFESYKPGEIINVKPYFTKLGIVFSDDSFAIYAPRQNLLIFGASEQNHDLLATVLR